MKSQEIKKKRGFYEIDGKQLPSVTTVIEEVLAKPQLRYWYGKVGNSEAGRISHEAKSFGSAMHKMIAEYLRSGQEPKRGSFMASEIERAWDVWYEWWNNTYQTKSYLRPDMVEQVIHNDEYAGTCDFFNGGTLVDWKFGGGIYPGYKIQAGAYARLLGFGAGGVRNALVVRIAKGEKNIEVLEMGQKELEEAAEIFDHLLRVFWWLRGGRK